MSADRALILIDFQTGFQSPVWGARNNPDAERNAQSLLEACRDAGLPVFHVRHISSEPGSPLGPDTGGTAFLPGLEPSGGEPIYEKSVNSAFIGTGLEADLRAKGLTRLIICGLTTPHCVSTSCRMSANLGFDVTLAHDACAAFYANASMGWKSDADALSPEVIHDVAIAHLHGEFVTARASADLIAETG
ncbi:cysteine hydrolase family protein [Primorskyibacter aestuariivivens]|uniref:cysteine hydrolase family protein n=1 Tax=Primorskyibacter aestuariivivens TaxID=1888912 RepID=UPI0023004720|nr:cysteine hydrolase family protein [Primorskyibacter aestuariivivens]MDA7427986.1 cysteine hydrolase family protein [Primorskyibacter aestuariivivens]